MENRLLIDCCVGAGLILQLHEASGGRGLVKFSGKFQEAEAVNKNKRMYPYDVLRENVDRLQQAIKERNLVGELDHACFCSNDFSVLTVEGMKPFTEIRAGDYVWSNVGGKMVKSRVNAIVDKPYDGPAYKMKGRAIDCTVTPEHKFLLAKRQDYKENNEQSYATIEDIHNNRKKYSHSLIPKTATWSGNESAEFTIPGIERTTTRKDCSQPLTFDAMNFARFMGIYLAEGYLCNKNGVVVTQKNEVGRELLRKFLPQLHPDIVWSEEKTGFYATDGRLHDYLVPLGNAYTKYIPQEVKDLDAKCLEELVSWFAIGDGRMLSSENSGKNCLNYKNKLVVENNDKLDCGKYGRVGIFSVSKQLIDDLHECVVKTGRCASRSLVETTEDYTYAKHVIRAENTKPLHQLSLSRSKWIHLDPRFLKITQVHHTGRIYCLSTEHGNFYMERNGHAFWTGNSDSIVHFATASHLITKLWWEGNTLMGEGEILSTPHGKVLKALLDDGVKIGISSRGVGNGKVNENGILVIGESYKLITFDVVADPSTFDAFQERVVAGRHESFVPSSDKKAVKNESRRLDTVNKDLLIAYLGGLVKTQTEKLSRGNG